MVSLISAIISQDNLHHLEKPKTIKYNQFTSNILHSRLLIRLFRHCRLRLFPPCPPLKQHFVFNPIQIPSHPISSSQTRTMISSDMANNAFSSSDASLSIRPSHGLGQQSQSFGGLVNSVKCSFWNCCNCGHVNNSAYCSKKCGNCGHTKCAHFCVSYTN